MASAGKIGLDHNALARGLNKKVFAVLIDPSKAIKDLPPELRATSR